MINGLLAARVLGDPERRAGKAGTSFVVAKVKAQVGDGETCLVNVIAFDADVCHELEALRDGDALSLTGSLTPKVWTDKQGNTRPALDMVAHKILSLNPGQLLPE